MTIACLGQNRMSPSFSRCKHLCHHQNWWILMLLYVSVKWTWQQPPLWQRSNVLQIHYRDLHTYVHNLPIKHSRTCYANHELMLGSSHHVACATSLLQFSFVLAPPSSHVFFDRPTTLWYYVHYPTGNSQQYNGCQQIIAQGMHACHVWWLTTVCWREKG